MESKTPELTYFWEYVKYWSEKNPIFPAVRHNDNIISGQELDSKSIQLAQALIHLGIEKGDRIVTVLPPIPEYVILMTAASQIGAILVPMDLRYRHTDFIRLIPTIEPKLIISVVKDAKVNFKEMLDQLQMEKPELQTVKYLFLDEDDSDSSYYNLFSTEYKLNKELENRKNDLDKHDDFLIIWTGGTTGFPKAAILTNNNVVRMCIIEDNILKSGLELRGETGRTKILVNLPVSHVGGSVELIGVGIVGGYEMLIHDRWSATRTLETIQIEKLSVCLAAPTMYRIMMAHKEFDSYDLSSMKLALISGEVVNQEYIDLMQAKFCNTIINGFGSTEMGPEVTFTHPDDDYSMIANGYVGKPLPGVKLRIADVDGNEIAIGKTGEVLVKGDLVCKGYFRNPKENSLGFTEDGWFKTGDLGKLDQKGGLWLQGRIKDVIRVGTYTVLPMEIEELVLQHFNLKLAAALSVPDDMLGEVVWLVITPQPNEEIVAEDVIALCEKELANYKVPKKVVFYEIDPSNPPMTRIGKIDKNRLKKEILAT